MISSYEEIIILSESVLSQEITNLSNRFVHKACCVAHNSVVDLISKQDSDDS